MIRNRTWTWRWVLACALAALGCPDPFGLRGEVDVRVANASSFDFQRVEVHFPEDEVNYGSVAAHRSTEYRRVSKAYGYAYIEVDVGGQELRIQPIDYVGESLLRSGRYTYELNLTVEGYLTLELRKDR